jgi:transcription elongation factor GreA
VVEIKFDGDEATEKYLFGSIEERQEGLEVISPSSPMGQALQNGLVGAKISYETEAGTLSVQIVSIEA